MFIKQFYHEIPSPYKRFSCYICVASYCTTSTTPCLLAKSCGQYPCPCCRIAAVFAKNHLRIAARRSRRRGWLPCPLPLAPLISAPTNPLDRHGLRPRDDTTAVFARSNGTRQSSPPNSPAQPDTSPKGAGRHAVAVPSGARDWLQANKTFWAATAYGLAVTATPVDRRVSTPSPMQPPEQTTNLIRAPVLSGE